jgi:hypothetical protein
MPEVSMAAPLRSTTPEAPRPQIPSSEPPPSLARAYLTRLSALHDEAARTAYLANLLGRAPYATAALAAAAIATAAAVAATTPAAELATWLVLVFAGVGAAIHAYSRAIRAPFELPTLQAFARDLSATLVYAGFAWGAGALLVLPASTSLLVLLAFGAGVPVLLAALLRVRDMALCFLVPAVSLSAFAAVLRPFSGGLMDLAALLIAGACVAAAAQIAERLAAPPKVPDPAGLPAV